MCRDRHVRLHSVFVSLALLVVAAPVRTEQVSVAREWTKTYIALADAAAALELHDTERPAELRGLDHVALERVWPEWVRRRDASIRDRLDGGDEDSVVNLWLYGTSFTARPRVSGDLAQRPDDASTADLIAGRLEDLLGALRDPGSNERLHFARDVFVRRNLSPSTPKGRAGIRDVLVRAQERARKEFDTYRRRIEAVERTRDAGAVLSTHGSLFQDRGLSSDTSVVASFAIEQALQQIAKTQTLVPGSVSHVGIVGPGLDIVNKADGYDFYPVQTVQPYGVVDSLVRHGLADARTLRVTTFDLNPRVNAHLDGARRRGAAGEGYLLHVLLNRLEAWRPTLLEYWSRFGDAVAEPAIAVEPPAGSHVEVRAVRVRASHVSSVVPRDVNIVLERPVPGDPSDRFDLLVATNVLVYYGPFEQALAMTNAASALRPGGVLLTNSAVYPLPPFRSSAHHLFVEASDRHTEHMFWYQRD